VEADVTPHVLAAQAAKRSTVSFMVRTKAEMWVRLAARDHPEENLRPYLSVIEVPASSNLRFIRMAPARAATEPSPPAAQPK